MTNVFILVQCSPSKIRFFLSKYLIYDKYIYHFCSLVFKCWHWLHEVLGVIPGLGNPNLCVFQFSHNSICCLGWEKCPFEDGLATITLWGWKSSANRRRARSTSAYVFADMDMKIIYLSLYNFVWILKQYKCLI